MTAPRPQAAYDVRWATAVKQAIDELEQRAHKKGQDVELSGGRVILTAPNGTRYALTVSNTGALSAVPV